MIKFFKNFRKDDSGAVTVDWVVLTAAVAALAGVVYTAISNGSSTLATSTGSYISGKTPTDSSSGGGTSGGDTSGGTS